MLIFQLCCTGNLISILCVVQQIGRVWANWETRRKFFSTKRHQLPFEVAADTQFSWLFSFAHSTIKILSITGNWHIAPIFSLSCLDFSWLIFWFLACGRYSQWLPLILTANGPPSPPLVLILVELTNSIRWQDANTITDTGWDEVRCLNPTEDWDLLGIEWK